MTNFGLGQDFVLANKQISISNALLRENTTRKKNGGNI